MAEHDTCPPRRLEAHVRQSVRGHYCVLAITTTIPTNVAQGATTHMRVLSLTLVLVLCAISPAVAQNCDTAGINALIDQYARTEAAGDMPAQSRLMAEDRVWVAPVQGRMTDQAMNMQGQQAWFDFENGVVREMAKDRVQVVGVEGRGDRREHVDRLVVVHDVPPHLAG